MSERLKCRWCDYSCPRWWPGGADGYTTLEHHADKEHPEYDAIVDADIEAWEYVEQEESRMLEEA